MKNLLSLVKLFSIFKRNLEHKIVVDDLANVIDIIPNAVELSSVSTSTVQMITDDNPVLIAQAASWPPDDMVAISMLVDDETTTITTAAESLDDTGILATVEGEPKSCEQETSDLVFAWKNIYIPASLVQKLLKLSRKQ